MARTYAASIRDTWRWREIRIAIERAVENLRATQANLVPTDGVRGAAFGVIANAHVDQDTGEINSSVYIGRAYQESPSGSFYAPWSNVSATTRDKDERWWAALDAVADSFGLSVMSGEGDPTDTYVYGMFPIEDPAELALGPEDVGAK